MQDQLRTTGKIKKPLAICLKINRYYRSQQLKISSFVFKIA